MFRQYATRLHSLASGLKNVQPSYFAFVDTNVILGYVKNQYDGLKSFIEDPNNKFFYTETVKSELTDLPGNLSIKPFHYIDSGLSTDQKNVGVQVLYEMWEKRAYSEIEARKKSKTLFTLTEAQKYTFHNDLFIIFEAGYAKYTPGVLPASVYQADLITNNLKLYKKFLQDPSTHGLMEKAVNLCGFEHLIEVKMLDDSLKSATHTHAPAVHKKPHG